MEDLEPICEAEQTSFCVELLKRLNMQRGQNYLCDVTLVAKEGKEFKAHRNVLSAASPFFAKLLQSDMKEKEEGVIRFEEISELILGDVLEFIYTGSVEINEGNAKELIIAADYLLLVCLKTTSGRFIEKQMTCSNCISTLHFAEKYRCEELVDNSTKFMHDNFASVAESDEFLNMEAEEVEKCISSENICVEAEEHVLRILHKWVERNKSERKEKFEQLFRHVRLVSISRDNLLDVVTNELVKENDCCLRKVLNALELVDCASEDTLIQSSRRRLETHGIVVCGGRHIFCYLPVRDKWKHLSARSEEESVFNQSTKMISFRDQLYTFSGRSNAERYDPVFNGWASLGLRLSYGTEHVAVVRGQIHAIDVDRATNKSTVKRYDVESYSWQTILSSASEGCRYNSCIVAAGNCLYVFGGRPSGDHRSEYVARGERFDTVGHAWEQIADMQEVRGNAFGVAVQGKIFIAGGENGNRRFPELKTCEVYTIITNEWQFIGSLNVPRLYGSMVCVNGAVYVLGGSRERHWQSEYTVEVYDPVVNEWTQRTSIPVDKIPEKERGSFRGCALKLSKGVLDKQTQLH